MDHKKAITSKERQDIVILLSDWYVTLEIVKRLNRDQRALKKGILKDFRKIMRVIIKKSELMSKKIFEKSGSVNINRNKRCKILRAFTKDRNQPNYHLQVNITKKKTCKLDKETHEI